ncbi:MAG: Zn-ribbon domain-containing OB-fold protein [Chloroflexota bacterium]
MSERPFTSASFQQYLNEKKLVGSRCKKCGALHLPPHPLCTKCYGDEMEWVEMKGKGKLAAFTCVYVAPTFMIEQGFDRQNPYCSGIVELEEGVKISARILGVNAKDAESIKIGTPMAVEFIEAGKDAAKKTYLGFKA